MRSIAIVQPVSQISKLIIDLGSFWALFRLRRVEHQEPKDEERMEMDPTSAWLSY